MTYNEMNDLLLAIIKNGEGSNMKEIAKLIKAEDDRQNRNVELIASENFPSAAVRAAMATSFTSKYAEGYPGKRYYGGCWPTDDLEIYCQRQWKNVFQCSDTYDVNVQPHSGTQANMAAIMATCKPGDMILSMSLNAGGHLSHGSPVSFSGKQYAIINYDLDSSGYIDLVDFEYKVKTNADQIKLVIIGASAYSREIPYTKMYSLVKKYNPDIPVLVDMAHVAGLISTGILESPFDAADIITTTTHKTLRGNRGGLIFTKPEYTKKVNSALFPGIQGGPLENMVAAKAVTANECLTEDYYFYTRQVVKNAKIMADEFTKMGYRVITGGTDNHMFLLDVYSKSGLTGKQVQEILDENRITVNKNMIPNDTLPPAQCSGIRIGTPAMTTKGWIQDDFIRCAHNIDKIITRNMMINNQFLQEA